MDMVMPGECGSEPGSFRIALFVNEWTACKMNAGSKYFELIIFETVYDKPS